MNIAIQQSSVKQKKGARIRDSQFIKQDCLPIEDILNNPKIFFEEKPQKLIAVLNFLFKKSDRYKWLWPSQETLAKIYGCTREHFNKFILPKLIEWGIVIKLTRHRETCLYKVSSFFKKYAIRRQLSHIFSAFQGLGLSMLLSLGVNAPTKAQSEECHTIKGKILNLFNTKYNTKYNSNKSMVYVRGEPLKKDVFLGVSEDGLTYSDQVDYDSVKSSGVLSMLDTKKNYGEAKLEIPQIIKDITPKLQLTLRGQIKLMVFSHDILKYAKTKLDKAKYVKNPYKLFLHFCNEYCKEYNIIPTWNVQKELEIIFKFDSDYPYTTHTDKVFKQIDLPYKARVQNETDPNPNLNRWKNNALATPKKVNLIPREMIPLPESYKNSASTKKVQDELYQLLANPQSNNRINGITSDSHEDNQSLTKHLLNGLKKLKDMK